MKLPEFRRHLMAGVTDQDKQHNLRPHHRIGCKRILLSNDFYPAATSFNALMFGIASFGAQWLLRHHYRVLIRRHPRHRLMLWTWLVVYGFVGIQMAWMLRPFIGNPGETVQFFRSETWGNAYIKFLTAAWQAMGG